jgi:hypothetical protein
MKKRRSDASQKGFVGGSARQTEKQSAVPRQAPIESWLFRLWVFPSKAARRDCTTPKDNQPRYTVDCSPELPTPLSKLHITQPPSMDSESEHEHRDDESVSDPEEMEETKPKSSLKKGREVLPPVARPELP